jgi:hypothetical protein
LETTEEVARASWRSVAVATILAVVGTAAEAQTTTNVNVVNTPTVRVTNPVLRVGVTNTVPVTGTVNANITNGSVTVSNAKAAPLFVDTEGSTRAAVGAECDGTFAVASNGSGVASCTLATVPAGETLVIETITCRGTIVQPSTPYLQLPVFLTVAAPQLGNPTSLSSITHTLLLTPILTLTGANPPLTYFGITAPLRVYSASSAAGSTSVGVQVQAGGQTSGQGGVDCAFSGYTVTQ